jgi:hypothetical protein
VAHHSVNSFNGELLSNVRQTSNRCSTCEGLRRLYGRNEAALRGARNLYEAAVKTADSTPLPNLEEEAKLTSAAREMISYAIHAHLIEKHSRTQSVLAA